MKQAVMLMVALMGCVDDASLATGEHYAIGFNAIGFNQITTNAIAANREASAALVASPLATTTGTFTSSAVRLGLEDPNAQKFMEYLVQCALRPDQQISWTSVTGKSTTYAGLYGLCPSWHTTSIAGNTTCRQAVSGCILARNNAFGVSVQLSLRGAGETGPLPFSPTVTPHGTVPKTPGDVIWSLRQCGGVPLAGYRDCSWFADKVGVCMPGEEVVIGAGAYASCGAGTFLGYPGGPMETLRVCAGHSSCDSWVAIPPIFDCATFETRAKFTCPVEGMYSVMKAAYAWDQTPTGVVASTTVGAELCNKIRTEYLEANPTCVSPPTWIQARACDRALTQACRYPASEQRVFRWLEGSFYGDIFGAEALNPAKPEVVVKLVKQKLGSLPVVYTHLKDGGIDIADGGALSSQFIGIVFPKMYACAGPNWTDRRAYMEMRVCAGPNPSNPALYNRDCAAQYVGACRSSHTDENVAAWPVCPVYEGLGKEHRMKCRNNPWQDGETWNYPITSVLAQPDDAIPPVSATVNPDPIESF